MQVQPYLFFEGRCDEAIAFYQAALGAEVTQLMRNKDFPHDSDSKLPAPSPEFAEKVMHAALRIGDSTLLLSDGRNLGQLKFNGFALLLQVPNDAEAQRLFTALAEGGRVLMPLIKTFYSSQFGMVSDRFGMLWSLMVAR
jgi:PhnB protein